MSNWLQDRARQERAMARKARTPKARRAHQQLMLAMVRACSEHNRQNGGRDPACDLCLVCRARAPIARVTVFLGSLLAS